MANTSPPQPFVPPLRHAGNRSVPFGGDSCFEALGVHELPAIDIELTPLPPNDVDDGEPADVEVEWIEHTTKRRRGSAAPLLLTLRNPSNLTAAISASLPARAGPATCGGRALTPGVLERQFPQRDSTPSLPDSLGGTVSFVTIAASV